MGTYVYKVTAQTVKLKNGEVANIAVYAYKPHLFAKYDQHSRSGAARHDAAAKLGKRSKWVIMGYEKDGKIDIDVDSVAQRLPVAMGSFTDSFFHDSAHGREKCKPVIAYQGKRKVFTRTHTITDSDGTYYLRKELTKAGWACHTL